MLDNGMEIQFLKSIFMKILFFCLFLLFGVSSCIKKTAFEFASPNFELIKLADGVYACIHKFGGKAICNVGIIDNGTETFIFDSFLSPEVAKELIVVVEKLKLSPIKYIVNSHAHNDHIRGNQVFSNDIEIISTAVTGYEIAVNEPIDIADEKEYAIQSFAFYDSLLNEYKGDSTDRAFLNIQMWRPYYEVLSNSHNEIITRVPNIYIDSIKTFPGTNRDIQLISRGKGHTKSDLVLYIPNDNILFAGDLVFNEMHPYLPSGYMDEWNGWLDYFNTLNVDQLVPGHGNVGGPEQIFKMKEYISDVYVIIKNIKRDTSVDLDFTKIKIPEKYKDWWFEQFFVSNLKFMNTKIQQE